MGMSVCGGANACELPHMATGDRTEANLAW